MLSCKCRTLAWPNLVGFLFDRNGLCSKKARAYAHFFAARNFRLLSITCLFVSIFPSYKKWFTNLRNVTLEAGYLSQHDKSVIAIHGDLEDVNNNSHDATLAKRVWLWQVFRVGFKASNVLAERGRRERALWPNSPWSSPCWPGRTSRSRRNGQSLVTCERAIPFRNLEFGRWRLIGSLEFVLPNLCFSFSAAAAVCQRVFLMNTVMNTGQWSGAGSEAASCCSSPFFLPFG